VLEVVAPAVQAELVPVVVVPAAEGEVVLAVAVVRAALLLLQVRRSRTWYMLVFISHEI
jgi:hypothetical protein